MSETKMSNELTLDEINLLTDQIENLNKAKAEVVKNRDTLEAELSKINKLLNTLHKCTSKE